MLPTLQAVLLKFSAVRLKIYIWSHKCSQSQILTLSPVSEPWESLDICWAKAVLLFSLRSWVLFWPWELNPWPPVLQSSALPTDLILLEDLCWFVANNAWIEKMLSNKAGDLDNFLVRLSKEASAIVTRSFTFLMCGSKNYPYMYLPPRRDFSSDLPPLPPFWKSSQASYIHLNFWA